LHAFVTSPARGGARSDAEYLKSLAASLEETMAGVAADLGRLQQPRASFPLLRPQADAEYEQNPLVLRAAASVTEVADAMEDVVRSLQPRI